MATIAEHGDPGERKHWPVVRAFFPLYERFWDRHIVPFRGPDGQIRPGIGGPVELMAQAHYQCFTSLRLAHQKLGETRHPEQPFSHLQNAANSARETIEGFNQLCATYLPAAIPVPVDQLRAFAARISPYRNSIHDDVFPKHLIKGVVYIPTVHWLAKNKRWSALKTADPRDLVVLRDELNKDFKDLCKLIDAGWTAMLNHSAGLTQAAEYQRQLRPTNTIIMRRVVLSSNTSR